MGRLAISVGSTSLNAKTICDEITFYGVFLNALGFCNPETGLLDAVGGSEFRPFGNGLQSAPTGVGTVELQRTDDDITATLTGTTLQSEEHNFGILAIDEETGVPVGLNYTERTEHAPESGTVQTVSLDLTDVEGVPATLRVYLMVGFPGETWETVQETVDLVLACAPHEFVVYPLIPYPGTPLYHQPDVFGITAINPDFSQYF